MGRDRTLLSRFVLLTSKILLICIMSGSQYWLSRTCSHLEEISCMSNNEDKIQVKDANHSWNALSKIQYLKWPLHVPGNYSDLIVMRSREVRQDHGHDRKVHQSCHWALLGSQAIFMMLDHLAITSNIFNWIADARGQQASSQTLLESPKPSLSLAALCLHQCCCP